MRNGARVFIEEVPLAGEAEAEHFSPPRDRASAQLDYLLSFVVGTLVAGALLVTLRAVLNLL